MLVWRNPAAWIGVIALAIPLAVHLLARVQAKTIAFPSLRFIQPSRLAALKRRRLTDAFLLTLRLLGLALAVAAFANPLFLTSARRAAWSAQVSRAIVIDTSTSMSRGHAAEDARIAATRERSESHMLRSTDIETTKLREGVERAVAWLQTTPPSRREIVCISDFQLGAVDAALLRTVPPDIGLRFVRVGTADVANERDAETRPVTTRASAGISGRVTGEDFVWRRARLRVTGDAVAIIGQTTSASAAAESSSASIASMVSAASAASAASGASIGSTASTATAATDATAATTKSASNAPKGPNTSNAANASTALNVRKAPEVPKASHARNSPTSVPLIAITTNTTATAAEVAVAPFGVRVSAARAEQAALLAAIRAVLAEGVPGDRGGAGQGDQAEHARAVAVLFAAAGDAMPATSALLPLAAPWMADALDVIARDEALRRRMVSSRSDGDGSGGGGVSGAVAGPAGERASHQSASASASPLSSASALSSMSASAPWVAVLSDSRGAPVLLAAARAREGRGGGRELVLVARMSASAAATPLLLRAVLRAIAGADPLPEAEVRTISDRALSVWTRPAAEPSAHAFRNVDDSDRRWLWAGVIAVLVMEMRLRREGANARKPTTAETEAHERAA